MTETIPNLIIGDSLLVEPGGTATFTGVTIVGLGTGNNSSAVVTFGANVGTNTYLVVNGTPVNAGVASGAASAQCLWFSPNTFTVSKLVYSAASGSVDTLNINHNGSLFVSVPLTTATGVVTLSPALSLTTGDTVVMFTSGTLPGSIYASLYLS